MEYLQFETITDFDIFTEGLTIGKEKRFTSIMFKNIGETDVTINGFKLEPGDPSVTFSSSLPSLDITEYNVAFTSIAGLANRVHVIRTSIVRAYTLTAMPKVCKPKKTNR